MTPIAPVWRSLLFVPAHVGKFVETAHRRDADAYILDLEDSVPADRKADARAGLAAAVRTVAVRGAAALVRINADPDMRRRDVDAAAIDGVAALMLPKVADPEAVRSVADALETFERERSLLRTIGLIAQIEDVAALPHLDAIAACSPRLIGLTLGSEDFSASAGMEPTPEALYAPSQQVVFACRRASILPFGYPGSIAAFRDIAAFADIVRRGREMGFVGGCAIHPDQVSLLNHGFAPSAEAVARAQALLDANAAAMAEGRGAFAFDGAMVDLPVLRRAEETLRRHAAVRSATRPLPEGETP